MKKSLFLLCLIISHNANLFAQGKNISVQYLVTQNMNTEVNSTKGIYNLFIKHNESVYYNQLSDSLNQFKYKDIISNTEQIGEFTKVKLSDNHYANFTQHFFYKNYLKDTLIFNEIIFRTKVIVGENIRIFNWNILPTKDTLILGYKCQTATADFRGRKYTAHFNQEINSFGGPWKFDGLPGLILAVRSHDNYFIIEPVKIALNTPIEPIKNPYQNLKKEDILNWSQYKEKYEKRMKDLVKKFKALDDKGSKISIKITDGVEDLGISEVKSEK